MPTTKSRPRAARSRPWTAAFLSVSVVIAGFVALLAVELIGYASNAAPMVVVAEPAGTTGIQLVRLEPEKFTDPEQSVTIRLRNASHHPVRVTVTMDAPDSPHAGTLTAALTSEGVITRSGPLSSLNLRAFTLGATSTTPLTLELDLSSADLAKFHAAGKPLTIAVGAAD